MQGSWQSVRLVSMLRTCQRGLILDARLLYSESNLADLYDPIAMPTELRKAHITNDKAVMAVYGFSTKMSEEDCVAELMKLYKKHVDNKLN